MTQGFSVGIFACSIYSHTKLGHDLKIKDMNLSSGHTIHVFVFIHWLIFFQKSVYIYYGLTNFYQNHRRYVRSRDDDQLHGDSKSPGSLIDDCDPYKTISINGTTYGYAPCGAIANSLFNG